jgi:hypothetical protein
MWAEIVEWYCTSMDLGKQPVMPSIANMWAKHVPVLNFNGFREATSNAELFRRAMVTRNHISLPCQDSETSTCYTSVALRLVSLVTLGTCWFFISHWVIVFLRKRGTCVRSCLDQCVKMKKTRYVVYTFNLNYFSNSIS